MVDEGFVAGMVLLLVVLFDDAWLEGEVRIVEVVRAGSIRCLGRVVVVERTTVMTTQNMNTFI